MLDGGASCFITLRRFSFLSSKKLGMVVDRCSSWWYGAIRAIHAQAKGEYGWPQMHKELLARGVRVDKDRVRKLMQ